MKYRCLLSDFHELAFRRLFVAYGLAELQSPLAGMKNYVL